MITVRCTICGNINYIVNRNLESSVCKHCHNRYKVADAISYWDTGINPYTGNKSIRVKCTECGYEYQREDFAREYLRCPKCNRSYIVAEARAYYNTGVNPRRSHTSGSETSSQNSRSNVVSSSSGSGNKSDDNRKFFSVVCTHCGIINSRVNSSLKATVCEHCGEAFIVSEGRTYLYTGVNPRHSQTSNFSSSYASPLYHSETSSSKSQNDRSDFVIRGGILEKYTGLSTSVTIPSDVLCIGEGAFKNCEYIQNVIIPNGVREIKSGAFQDCKSLQQIDLPDSITNICYGAFSYSGLRNVVIPSGVRSLNGFTSCCSLNSITIPSSVTEIQDSAFSSCTSLQSISIPSSVKIIRGSAFCNCTSLQNITIALGVVEIKSCAFSGCTSLRSISIPSTVQRIGENAFSACSNLTNVSFPSGISLYDRWLALGNSPLSDSARIEYYKQKGR